MVHVALVEAVAQKTSGCSGCAVEKHGGYAVACRQRRDLIACCKKTRVGADQKGNGLLLDKGRKSPLGVAPFSTSCGYREHWPLPENLWF
jgi:hypothetical protein